MNRTEKEIARLPVMGVTDADSDLDCGCLDDMDRTTWPPDRACPARPEEEAMPKPDWKLEDDLKTVTLTLGNSSTKFDATAVSEILNNLGEFRAAMSPAIPIDYEMGQKVACLGDPCWACEPEILGGNTLLHIRDERFGWLHYLLPTPEAAKLAAAIQVQVENAGKKPDRAN